MKKFESEQNFPKNHFEDFEPMYSIRSSEQGQAVESDIECHLAVCVDTACLRSDCPRRWRLENRQSSIRVSEEFMTLDLDLGEGRSMDVVDSLLRANREILGEFTGGDLIKNYSKKSAKKTSKKLPKNRKKKKIKQSKDFKPFLQEYQKKWQRVFNQNGAHFRNQLVLNPLIFGGFTVHQPTSSSKKQKKKLSFPKSNKPKQNKSRRPQQTNSFNLGDPTKGLIPPRPRFSLQHRRKSSLLNQDSEPEPTLNPLLIERCKSFYEFGICLRSSECVNLHDFRHRNCYQHLIRRFANVLMVEIGKRSFLGLEGFLNKFHSLHRPLPVFRKLLFRRPETCIFDLIKR